MAERVDAAPRAAPARRQVMLSTSSRLSSPKQACCQPEFNGQLVTGGVIDQEGAGIQQLRLSQHTRRSHLNFVPLFFTPKSVHKRRGRVVRPAWIHMRVYAYTFSA